MLKHLSWRNSKRDQRPLKSALGHSRRFSNVRNESALPSIGDGTLNQPDRREGPCVDGSGLSRASFTSQRWS